jgi:hypothetical protein
MSDVYCRSSCERRSSGRLCEGGWTNAVRAMRGGLLFIFSIDGGGTVVVDAIAVAVLTALMEVVAC